MNKNLALPLIACTCLLSALTSCGAANEKADLVVYGKIYTSEKEGRYATSFAVKDGKYIYVGGEEGAKRYIQEGKTKIIDRRGNGLIAAGATEGHGHYITAAEISTIDAFLGGDNVKDILKNIEAHIKKHPEKEVYFTQGWTDEGEMVKIKNTVDMKSALDEICSTKPIVMMNDVGHSAFLNSKAFELAGFDKDTVIEGGSFSKDEKGELLGLADDVAVNYVMEKVVLPIGAISKNEAKEAIKSAADSLHANGYTNYFDAYSNFFGENTYSGISEEDKDNGLSFNLMTAYKIDPYNNMDEKIAEAERFMAKYSSPHFQPNNIKLFADGGAVEVKTGWMIGGYADGSHGNQVWENEAMDEVVRKANEKGLSIHAHASGDGATSQVVDACIKAEATAKKGVYNGLGHSRHITEETKDKMAAHHIYSATNIDWRYAFEGDEAFIKELMDYDTYLDGYPMKSLIDRGITLTSSTDYPANGNSPIDICGIIEIGVNGTIEGHRPLKFKASEFLTVEEMLDVMTINGAKQFQLEKERGSIKEGKYADFIFLDKDITSCPLTDIHAGKVETVYFEGDEVYTLPEEKK